MDNVANYIIKIAVQNQQAIKKIAGDTSDLTNRVNKSTAAFNRLARAAVAAFSFSRIANYAKIGAAAYEAEAIAIARLGQVMRNTMGATDAQTQSILDLAAAQQKLGVIGDEIQIAGAQELATYLSLTDSLKTLLPVMNNMLAQQYGLNATQEQAVQIASMLGKVMDGQTGALSRYGYKFSEAQENILKYGTEAQRVAVLANVVNSAVGGVNEALAKTPEGKLKQTANNMGDIQERVGKLWLSIKSALTPAVEMIGKYLDRLIVKFENNRENLIAGVRIIANVIGRVIGTVVNIFNVLNQTIKWLNQNASPVLVFLSSFIAALVAVRVAIVLWSAAQKILNVILTANPIGIVIAIIVALIAAITYVIYKTEGWGKTWGNVLDYMSLSLEHFKGFVSLKWLQIQDFFAKGFAFIQKGWYGLQSLWDKEGANEGLTRLQDERDQRAEAIARSKNMLRQIREQMKSMKVFELSWNSEKGFKDIFNSLKAQLGLSDDGSGNSNNSLINGSLSASTEAIATGGTRSTNVTINVGNMVEQMNFNRPDMTENIENMQDRVLDTLIRVLNLSQSTVR